MEVSYTSAEVLQPEVIAIAPKDAEVVTITEVGLLKSHKQRRSRISKSALGKPLYLLAH